MKSYSLNDIKYIEQCFNISRKGLGHVSPNPLVGAILVKDDKIIGRGYHKKFGEAHAEVNAIKNATENVAGSTLYCNLEPCCHTNKKTPPCVPLIIQRNIKRVVISNLDPNKEVNGKGVKQLKDAGIEVVTGILENDGSELNKFYFRYIKEKLPYITLKIAQSIDGKISQSRNKQTWLTGKESVKYVHKLRCEYDSVLVGANTIKVDNPMLTVREVKGRNPIRIILDGSLSIPISSKVLNNKNPESTWIITSSSANNKKIEQITDKGVKVFQINSELNQISLKKILQILIDQKVTSILVEGGADIFNQFLEKDLFCEVIIFQASQILGKGIGYSNLQKLKNFQLKSIEKLGDDVKLAYKKKSTD